MVTSFDPEIGKTTRWKKGGPSPNPGGRPKSRLLSKALTAKLSEIKPDDPDGRTYAEVLAANLVELACSQGRCAVAAASEVGDRTEGRAAMALAFADVSAGLESRSDNELKHFLTHGFWPDEREQPDLAVEEQKSEK